MEQSRRSFIKKSIWGAVALGAALPSAETIAATTAKKKKKAKRIVLLSLDVLEDDGYVPNYEKAFSFLKTNKEHPTLVFLYSVHTDHAGHKYKWMSPEYIRSIEEADVEIGRFLEKMKAEGLYDDTHFMFLTDHGGIEYGHGGVSTHEMIVPWGICGPGIAKGLQMEEPNNTVNTAAIILHLFGVSQPSCWTGEVPESIFSGK